MLVKTFVQIFAIKYFNNGYVWWLTLEIVFAVIASYALHLIIKKTFPFIEPYGISPRC